MSSNSYPLDELGNKLKVGDMVMYKLADASALFRVVDVSPASILQAPGGGMLPTQGAITLQMTIQIGYQMDEPHIVRAIAIRIPEPGAGATLDASGPALVKPS